MKDLTRSNSICPPPEAVLLESVKKNDVDTIRTLIKSNKDLLTYEYPYTSKNILATACNEDGVDAQTIQTLIDLGADTVGTSEYKPLHLAAVNSDSAILDVIIDNIPSGHINDTVDGNTALHTLIKSNAIKQNEAQFCKNVQILLKAGINVNQTDSKNVSAVYWAARNGYKSVLKVILETSVSHVDLDHQLRGKSARDFIREKQLYSGALPERVLYQNPKDYIFSLIKQEKEDDFIRFLNALTHPSDFVNLDDGTSTLLQYSCNKGLPKVAKYLVENGADVNKIISNHGKTPLELAARNGFYEVVDILIKVPCLEISSETLCDVIKHSDNPKFGKIDHEKCCQTILDALTVNTMDVNEKDQVTNTPIHYALRYANEATTQKLLSLGASLACKNQFGTMPIQDIKPELLERHLDDCVKFDINNRNDEKRDFKIDFDYQSLVPPQRVKDKSDCEDRRTSSDLLPEMEVINYMSQAPEFRPLLTHPVIVSFLFLKWHRIRLLFYTNVLFYIVFVASLVTYIFSYYANFDTELSDFCVGIGGISWIILNLTFWILLLRETFQIAVSPSNYFRNFENYVEIVLILITGMILYISSPTQDTRKQLASVAILLSAFELVLMVGQHPQLSTNVVMLKTVSKNFFKLLLWYSLLIIAFALSFYILFAKTELPQKSVVNATETEEEDLFTGPGKSLFKTIVMLTGEFDAGSMNFHTYPVTSKLIFTLFVFMITIILLNLLNGLAVSDTQKIKNEAELVGHIARAQHIYYVESMLLGNILPTFLFKSFQRLFCCFPHDRDHTYTFFKPLARRVCLFHDSESPMLTVFPNNCGRICKFEETRKNFPKEVSCSRSCTDTYLDKETVRRINSIVKARLNGGSRGVDAVEELFAEVLALKAKLDCVLGKLEGKN